MSDDKVNVESETKVNSGEIEKPSSTEEVLSDSDAKIPTSTEGHKSGNEVDNVLLALAEDPAQNLFMDVFRRADKNDNLRISFEEFEAYFGDNNLSKADLLELFNIIDTHHTNELDLGELYMYFRKGFEPYSAMFASLEPLHRALSKTLDDSAQNYLSLSFLEQFKVRFYLKEFLQQLETLHRPVSVALSRLEQVTPVHKEVKPKLNKNASTVNNQLPNVQSDSMNQLHHEVMRLSNIIEKLQFSSKKSLDSTGNVGEVQREQNAPYLMVYREFQVTPKFKDDFLQNARTYLKHAKTDDGLVYSYFQEKKPNKTFAIYQVWTSEEELHAHYATDHYRYHARGLVDVLLQPEKFQSVPVPTAWWS
jgi:quinol monooxygenase YgiN/Ca2+-binding EF-hand superfamily protein